MVVLSNCVLGPTPSVKEGRGGLLSAIKKGKALKKVELPPQSSKSLLKICMIYIAN